MELHGRTVLLLVEQQFNDQEFWYPFYRLLEAEVKVIVVGTGTARTYTGKAGTVTGVDRDAASVDISKIDGVVIPGGFAPDFMRRSKEMVALVTELNARRKMIAAICHGGWMLASAKILTGRTVTSFFAIRDDLEHAGATWVDQEVCVDGNLITSRTPDDLPAFMRTVIRSLR
ncbi:type 1 glutamine amidotransferase [Desulfobotulus sp. H1]|uniref:Type 1 glutamine amidotransferase n=1 Tax=Desulfobotulus pelophilus TaxID=2823377 RepID=A0ABT3N6J2_9BACT|nr:type 1 glutamine amidotransferase domain-containing protein [Desulfobotulus pelophilus]MCW7753081.1 type 1 glutamine amidotransferase [Desulfobotulus pelophilus]